VPAGRGCTGRMLALNDGQLGLATNCRRALFSQCLCQTIRCSRPRLSFLPQVFCLQNVLQIRFLKTQTCSGFTALASPAAGCFCNSRVAYFATLVQFCAPGHSEDNGRKERTGKANGSVRAVRKLYSSINTPARCTHPTSPPGNSICSQPPRANCRRASMPRLTDGRPLCPG
jgi:hypothetical protein